MKQSMPSVVDVVGWRLTDVIRRWAARRNQEPAVVRVTITRLHGNERLGHVDLDINALRRLRDLLEADTPTGRPASSRPDLHLVGGEQ